ncbi:response regulator transcription factor [Chitinimonas koreensis]|uniref:response regulator transcription factor n=1 Tax=Chitinimonas koreensis TaxID=356302 RepID=UPI00040F96C8|nr:response regulator transcription factor [Chitinimonas koreensis]QNM95880.1 response regulator transcription factor [Chitinimonas koreensis]
MSRIRIVLAEDQALVRGALAALLRLEGDLDVVGEAGDGRAALERIEQLRPDVLLTDIEMPLLTGLDVARTVKERGWPTRVVIVTTFGRAGYLRRALEAGVAGYLLKDAPSEQLAAAIRRVAAGGRAIDPELAMAGWDGDDPLTERERQVLRLAGEGRSSAEIAELIHLSEGTVRNKLSEAIGKLGAANRVEAARIARDKGWL